MLSVVIQERANSGATVKFFDGKIVPLIHFVLSVYCDQNHNRALVSS